MIVKNTKYVIATKAFPLEFENADDCEDTGFIENAFFYDHKKEAEDEFERFDLPEEHQIIKVNITYEF